MMSHSMNRPTVTITYAQTLDGRIATRSGNSQWISGTESLRFAHALRASHDAIMVGVGTVLRDNPRLTVRLAPGTDPLRVVVDSTLATPASAAVLADGAAAGTIVAVTERADAARRAEIASLGADVLVVGSGADGRVDLRSLLAALHERNIGSVMVEGGARLMTSLLHDHLADQLAVCIAPKILGAGIDAIGDLGIDTLDLALHLDHPTITRYGPDLVIDGRLVYPSPDVKQRTTTP
jgi:5-amino-6-(5-phosphoribosylamino)uracil reductase/diaminohydroxyphosphoribosylaminopyrimidine deaminase/5-amino-6-(5-phosphoribosylamino)uracil reductase